MQVSFFLSLIMSCFLFTILLQRFPVYQAWVMPSLSFLTILNSILWINGKRFIPSCIYRYLSLYLPVTYSLFEVCPVLIVSLKIPFPNPSPGCFTHYVHIPPEVLFLNYSGHWSGRFLPPCLCILNCTPPPVLCLSYHIRLYWTRIS